jgi:hypothetical protein
VHIFRLFHIDLFFRAESRFHETELHIIAQVGSPVRPAPGPAASAKTEKIFENVSKTGKDVFETAKTGKPRPSSPWWPYWS